MTATQTATHTVRPVNIGRDGWLVEMFFGDYDDYKLLTYYADGPVHWVWGTDADLAFAFPTEASAEELAALWRTPLAADVVSGANAVAGVAPVAPQHDDARCASGIQCGDCERSYGPND